MPKGSTVFAQIMSLIPRRQFNNCVARHNGDYRIRNFSCYDQFLVMIMAQYANKNSLRDIEASLTAISHKLYHSGISYAVPRNTLAKADVQGQFFVPVYKMSFLLSLLSSDWGSIQTGSKKSRMPFGKKNPRKYW
ncbi:MAG: DUF4372 domain-containing protein [Bacteroidales bacterium]|nr:DUF4372 domain-containing protein [Bacteroidales bacterium]